MLQVKVSPKFQIVIPKEVREKLTLRKGQKMTVLAKGGVIVLMPDVPLKQYRGFLKGMDSSELREKQDRV